MTSIALVTDSTAYLPPELVEQYNISVIPLYVNFGKEAFLDGVDMSPEQFYTRLQTSTVLPTTSQPSAGDFIELYRSLVDAGASTILSIHISSGLSGTVSSAQLARAELPDVDIRIVDSRSTSMEQGFVVLAAARALEAGWSVDEIIPRLEALRESLHLRFVVDTLEYLHKGGRIGGAQALLGSMLSLKPLLTVHEGKVAAVERVRTKKRAVRRLLDIFVAEAAGQTVDVAVIHAGALKEGEALRQMAAKQLGCRETWLVELSPAIGTHVGPGTVGMVMCPILEY